MFFHFRLNNLSVTFLYPLKILLGLLQLIGPVEQQGLSGLYLIPDLSHDLWYDIDLIAFI